jgi:antitoxin (DNA-binding transcriptional repressor) of toxin-antitoxin stability system
MRAVGIKVLKNKVSEYVRLAAGGERILVTDRDRVVAELVPPAPGRLDSVDDARLADLVRQGLLTPPLAGPAEPPPSIPRMPLAEILEGLAGDRVDR